mgnify:CR=1 FL=1
MYYIIDDVWCYIKHFIFHNIQYSKHLEDDIYVKSYNNVIETLPRYCDYMAKPKHVFNKSKNITKHMYHVMLPKTNSLMTLIEYEMYNEI